MKRYAMPVDPRVLEKDFKSTINTELIETLHSYLKGKDLKNISKKTLEALGRYLEKAWYLVNEKRGINLRDREKLEPIFLELNRIFEGKKIVDKAYRGVRLSNFDPNAISRTYPNSINDPEVREHLEGLAYGLRSWSEEEITAVLWATTTEKKHTKDRVVFEIENKDVAIDSSSYVYNYFERNFEITFMDPDEVILNVKNPKILEITETTHPIKKEVSFYLVKIVDIG